MRSGGPKNMKENQTISILREIKEESYDTAEAIAKILEVDTDRIGPLMGWFLWNNRKK